MESTYQQSAYFEHENLGLDVGSLTLCQMVHIDRVNKLEARSFDDKFGLKNLCTILVWNLGSCYFIILFRAHLPHKQLLVSRHP